MKLAIKEEPRLWRRCWHDGQMFLRLLLAQALPLALAARWQRLRFARRPQTDGAAVILHLAGDAAAPYVATAVSEFRAALNSQKPLLIDLSAARRIDSRFFGLLLMLKKQLEAFLLVFPHGLRDCSATTCYRTSRASDVSSVRPAAAASR